MSDDLVSVVMPCHNGARFLDEAIGSVLDQTHTNLELVLVDDGSLDDSMRRMRSWQNKDSRVRALSEPRRGVSMARNKAISLARGRFVTFLDCDDLYFPDALERQLMSLREDGLSFCHGNAIEIDYLGEFRRFLDKNSLPRYPDSGPEEVFRRLIQRNFIAGGSVMVRREALPPEPFDKRLSIGEDWDLWVRLSQVYNLGYVKEPVFSYRIHQNNTYDLASLPRRRNIREEEARAMLKWLYELEMGEPERDIVADGIAGKLIGSRSLPAILGWGLRDRRIALALARQVARRGQKALNKGHVQGPKQTVNGTDAVR